MRTCRRRFVLLSEGDVLIRWACDAWKKVPNPTGAVDAEILADRFAEVEHHHQHHLHHHKKP